MRADAALYRQIAKSWRLLSEPEAADRCDFRADLLEREAERLEHGVPANAPTDVAGAEQVTA